MGAEDDAGLLAGQGADDVAEPGLAGQRFEMTGGKEWAQLRGEVLELRRAGRALPDCDLLFNEPPGSGGVEAIWRIASGRSAPTSAEGAQTQ